MIRPCLLLALLFSLPSMLHAQSSRDAINKMAPPAIAPWKKPVYPESKETFIEGMKQAEYQLVCGVKEIRDCMGFTSQCRQEISVYMDECVKEGKIMIPSSFASSEDERNVNRLLFRCVTKKQQESGAGAISLEACNKVEEMQKRSSGSNASPPPPTGAASASPSDHH